MAINIDAYTIVMTATSQKNAVLVAVSKFKSIEDIQSLYDLGQRDFGENFVQELVLKYEALPKDIRWHFIGHLQSNKVKYIAPFIHLIHGVDSKKLLVEINKQAQKNNRLIDCLLQVHIAQEETKFGFDDAELNELMISILNGENAEFSTVSIRGLMGMASFSDDKEKVTQEFKKLSDLYSTYQPQLADFNLLSMGMSGDYEVALQEGSNMIRVGSLLFGARTGS